MIAPSTAALFLLVVLAGAMTPGPDFVMVTRSALLGGRRAGMACALGITCGVFLWVVAIALGVAALLAASAVAFTVVKLAGAAYLVVLGVRAWLAVRRNGYAELDTLAPPEVSATRAFRNGLLCNLLNPKVAMFFLALLPQFLPHSASTLATLSLAAVGAVASVVWWMTVAVVVGSLRRFFAAPRVRRALDGIMGTLLLTLGLRVAIS
ncbi:LysE family translocator [Pseudonocardia eucalypti]|uniref:LysE family translocator n=1 Tax=Pseudonocardia eucalypti TaxID=648755 RepID=A0ABP9Q2Z0_9PSEU|nr:threonine/homoserine/homoserine lactone efflux protein [Pseudonocardia eucalypti]